ncbi:MAG TPA: tetratricopeptide repeat protein [Vicinamibacteria bacterium]
MRLNRGLAVVVAVVAVSAAAQEAPDQQARRLLEDGRAYWAQGKLKQALDNFNTIVAGFAGTDSIGPALLEIGRYRLEVDGDVDKARASFEQVAKQYPQSDAAPGAYYNLGLLTLSRATTTAELDDALAQLTRVLRLYPKSDWVPKALHAQGLVHRKAGRYAEAVDVARRVFLEYPSSDAAPAGQYLVGQGLALLGEPRQAMEEFQRVRNRFPESEWAARALERTTALYRLHGYGPPRFTLDPSYNVGVGDLSKNVRAILMTPQGTLWISSDKTKSTVPLDPSGKPGPGVPGEDPRALSLDPRGQIVVAARLAVRVGARDIKSFTIPSDKPLPEPLERITAAVITPGGSILVADEKRNKVYRYNARAEFQATFPDPKDAKEREITRLLVDGEGGIVMLDRGEKTVRVYDETGKLLRTVGPTGLRRPADVAIDPFRNTYIADEELGVLIFSPQGQILHTLSGPEIRRPKALTLDPTGAILVWDERAEKVLRYR